MSGIVACGADNRLAGISCGNMMGHNPESCCPASLKRASHGKAGSCECFSIRSVPQARGMRCHLSSSRGAGGSAVIQSCSSGTRHRGAASERKHSKRADGTAPTGNDVGVTSQHPSPPPPPWWSARQSFCRPTCPCSPGESSQLSQTQLPNREKNTGRCVNILVYRTYKRLNIRVGGFRARGVNKGGDHGRWDGPSQMTLSLQTARDKGHQRAREDDEGD